jgi:hypothetical protein
MTGFFTLILQKLVEGKIRIGPSIYHRRLRYLALASHRRPLARSSVMMYWLIKG